MKKSAPLTMEQTAEMLVDHIFMPIMRNALLDAIRTSLAINEARMMARGKRATKRGARK